MKKDLRRGKVTKLVLKEEFGATSVSNILESLGYEDTGYDEELKCTIYVKDSKWYRFIEWEHFNGYVYYITVKEVI